MQSNRQSPFKAIVLDHPSGLRPYGQPGPLPIMVTLVTLLIELKAQIMDFSLLSPLEFFVDPKNVDGRNN